MCLLFNGPSDNGNFKFFECGASLIANGIAVTAAHCIK